MLALITEKFQLLKLYREEAFFPLAGEGEDEAGLRSVASRLSFFHSNAALQRKLQKFSCHYLSTRETEVKVQDMFLKNQQLSTEFDLYVLDHPNIADRIPDGALVVFLPEFDKGLARKNQVLAAKMRERGQTVVYPNVA